MALAEACTLTAEQVADILTRLGFEVPRDLAGLTSAEIQEVLQPYGQADSGLLEELRTHGRRRALKRDCQGASLMHMLPSSAAVNVRPDSWSNSEGMPRLVPTQPRRLQSDEGDRRQSEKLHAVARTLVEAVLQRGFSQRWVVVNALPSAGARDDWVAAMAASLAGRFERATLDAAYRLWKRLLQWIHDAPLPLACPAPAHLRQFLVAQQPRGRTVPAAAFRQLQWFEQHLGVPFCTASPVLADFGANRPSTLPQQTQVISLLVWRHLLALASQPKDEWTARRLAAALVLRYIVSGLRFKHTKRAQHVLELSSSRSMTWKVSKGKDGQPFAVSLPTHVQPNQPLFTDLQVELLRRFGETVPFMPDCLFEHGEICIYPVPATYSRFQQFVRSLLRLPRLSLADSESDQYSTYSFRRFLPSVADTLNLSDADRNCLGNWQDGQRLPLNVRYSSEKLESAASVWRLCLAALHHLLKHDENPSLLKLRGVLSHVPPLRAARCALARASPA